MHGVEHLETRLNFQVALDPQFDVDGIARVSFSNPSTDAAEAIVVQPDGRIVVAGYSSGNVGVARFLETGAIDNSFSLDGRALAPMPSAPVTTDIAIDSLGRIVVCGYLGSGTARDAFLLRFTSGGERDESFGNQGLVLLDHNNTANDFTAIAIQSDNRIVATGNLQVATNDIVIARFGESGLLDASFSNDGLFIFDSFGFNEFAGGVILGMKDKILVGCSARFNTGAPKVAVLRFHSVDGALDTSYGIAGGVAYSTAINTLFVDDLVELGDGSVVAGGISGINLAMAKFTPAGQPDLPFGTSGVRVYSNASGSHEFRMSMAVQQDGKILLGGGTDRATSTAPYKYQVLRVGADGSPDSTLSAGSSLFQIDANGGKGLDMAIAPNGRIVFCGSEIVGTSLFFAVLRLVNDNPAPVVTNAVFAFPPLPSTSITFPAITFTYDRRMGGQFDALRTENLDTGQLISRQLVSLPLVAGQPSQHRVTYLSSHPDGNYRATVRAGFVFDAAQNPLAQDYSFDFFLLRGDANHDRLVDIADFSILAAKFNQSGGFADGDFDFNGTVNISDFAILAAKFNTSLPPAGASAARFALPTTRSLSVERQTKSGFANDIIDELG